MNIYFGKKNHKESKDIVQLVTTAKTLSDELDRSLADVILRFDVIIDTLDKLLKEIYSYER